VGYETILGGPFGDYLLSANLVLVLRSFIWPNFQAMEVRFYYTMVTLIGHLGSAGSTVGCYAILDATSYVAINRCIMEEMLSAYLRR